MRYDFGDAGYATPHSPKDIATDTILLRVGAGVQVWRFGRRRGDLAPRRRSRRRKRADDFGGRPHPRDSGQDLLDREPVHVLGEARDRVLGDDDCVIVLPALARGRLDAEIGRDARQYDGADPASAQLEIEFGAVECAPLPLLDEDVGAKRADFGREIDSYAITQGRPLLAAEMERELLARL